jgi:alpha-maltose-1-phosphate synthase
MKALFLTNEYPPYVYGGAGVHVEYLTRELSRLMEVDVRCFGDQRQTSSSLQVHGFQVPPELLVLAPEKLKSPLGTLVRCTAFNAIPVDAQVVHCHTWYSHFGGILTKLLYGIPLVITTHSLEPLRPWKREQLGRGYDLSSWVERTALEMADAVIAVSEETRRDILQHFHLSGEKIKVIPNGIDTEEYQRRDATPALQRYSIPLDLPFVLFVGRIARQKGIIHLVNAIRYLAPQIGVVLCAGAPDTKEIEAEMAAGVKEVQQGRPHVYWIREMLPKQDAIQLYSAARVFCCPSIYEPFGIINLEAMACGTPVVASAVGGIKEVVLPEQTGLLVPFAQESQSPFEPIDPDRFARDLAQAINSLMADPARCLRLGQQGRARAVEEYSWHSIAKRVHALYQQLVEVHP